jgi:hypothetical protein
VEPVPTEYAVTFGIRRLPKAVVSAIHLNHQPRCRCVKIHNIPPAKRHLSPKQDAQLSLSQRFPKHRFAVGQVVPVPSSILLELRPPPFRRVAVN